MGVFASVLLFFSSLFQVASVPASPDHDFIAVRVSAAGANSINCIVQRVLDLYVSN